VTVFWMRWYEGWSVAWLAIFCLGWIGLLSILVWLSRAGAGIRFHADSQVARGDRGRALGSVATILAPVIGVGIGWVVVLAPQVYAPEAGALFPTLAGPVALAVLWADVSFGMAMVAAFAGVIWSNWRLWRRGASGDSETPRSDRPWARRARFAGLLWLVVGAVLIVSLSGTLLDIVPLHGAWTFPVAQ